MSDTHESGKGYDHTARVPGTRGEPSPATEHRDLARGDAEDRNELTPDQRGRADGDGPRTHKDTEFTRKDGADRA